VTDQEPIAPLPTPPAVDNSATRAKRLGAFLIDWVILAGFMGMLFEYLDLAPTQSMDMNAAIIEMAQKMSALPSADYWTLFFFPYVMFFLLHGYLLFNFGQTIGKRVMGIAIVTLDNRKPPFANLILQRYLTQWVLGMIPNFGIIIRALDVSAIFRDDKRCVHDLIAGTKVIDLRIPTAGNTPGQQGSLIV